MYSNSDGLTEEYPISADDDGYRGGENSIFHGPHSERVGSEAKADARAANELLHVGQDELDEVTTDESDDDDAWDGDRLDDDTQEDEDIKAREVQLEAELRKATLRCNHLQNEMKQVKVQSTRCQCHVNLQFNDLDRR